ncbi:uncharacterized protein LOC124370312 [Homalodisca vitripennis]|uniref:uncharacterized protein LOC124370312 n=1 Tax=Homalodisca vitripennis TaxID=197043 RepID=UPI001EEA3FAE|nr:uncharacterized protein LOC124370312 [Homalodisca vitripennis]
MSFVVKKRKLIRSVIPRFLNVLLREVAEAIDDEANRQRTEWVREWLKRRNTYGASSLLLTELAMVFRAGEKDRRPRKRAPPKLGANHKKNNPHRLTRLAEVGKIINKNKLSKLSPGSTVDEKEYKKCLRMTPIKFNELLDMVSDKIKREDTMMREAIPSRLKLEVTLNFLATGNNYRSLSHFFRISIPAISKFVPEVCEAISEVLNDSIKVNSNIRL